jgi:sparc/osteonectin/cwcv/kazal-like domain-containing proteoglycan (testican)
MICLSLRAGDHFPGDCKREVQWMFSHLNSDDDGQLSLQELFDLENDRNEKCIKPFLDRCDTDKLVQLML